MITNIYKYIGLMFLMVLVGTVALYVLVPLLPFIAFGLICLMVAHKIGRKFTRW